MQLKVRSQNSDGTARLESMGEIKEVKINEDIMHPNKESIALCFVGKSSSGIIELTPKEVEDVYQAVKSRMHLIKGFKRIQGGNPFF